MSLIGTPLPSVEANDKEKFVPVWKQEARDELGRKRFHGAFTGGFSAGYHNTVGSKEGWAPSSFTSSREYRSQDTTQPKRQAIEEFMDEEDLRDIQKDSKLIATDNYKETVTVKKEGLGWHILRKMGWNGDPLQSTPVTELFKRAARSSKQATTLKLGMSKVRPAAFAEESDDEDDDDRDYNGMQKPEASLLKSTILSVNNRQTDYKEEIERKGITDSIKSKSFSPIDGFVPSLGDQEGEIGYGDKEYPPIMVPNDFKESIPNFENVTVGTIIHAKKTYITPLTVEERSRALGDNAQLSSILPKEQVEEEIRLDVLTALAAQRGYMPFPHDPLKAARYMQFLAHFAAPHTIPLLPTKPSNKMTNEEFKKEQREFVKVASIFKPLSSSMASKFVSATGTTTDVKTETNAGIMTRGGLYKPIKSQANPLVETKDQIRLQTNEAALKKSKSPDEESNFEKKARTTIAWKPASLLCKRLGIEEPKLIETGIGPEEKSVKPILGYEAVKEIVSKTEYAGKVDLSSLQEKDSTATEDTTVDEYDEPSELLIERASMDLFKSIFGDDNDEELKEDKSQLPSLLGSQDDSLKATQTTITPSMTSVKVDETQKEPLPGPQLLTASLSDRIRPEAIIVEPTILRSRRKTKKEKGAIISSAFSSVHTIEEPVDIESITQPKIKVIKRTELDDYDNDELTRDDKEEGQVVIKKKRPAASDLW